jgi:hypothetical protein
VLKAISLLSIITLVVLIGVAHPANYGDLGTNDFIQYWRSWEALRRGLNPYDPEVLATFHDKIKWYSLSWNPPWTFTLLAPVLSFSLGVSSTIWLLIQLLFLLLLAVTVPAALKMEPFNLSLRAFTVATFFPLLSSIYWGQLGSLLVSSLALFLYLQQRNSLFLAGLALIPLSVKPHLLFLFAIPGLLWLTQLPKIKAIRFICGAVSGGTALLAITLTLNPAAISEWLAAMNNSSMQSTIKGVPFENWQTATIASWLRTLLASNYIPTWPLKVVPLTAFAVTAIYFTAKREVKIEWQEIAPWLLPLTLLFNSYGWAFDQSVLIITQFATIGTALRIRERLSRYLLIAAAFGVQILAIAISDNPQHSFVWLPIAMLGLYILSRSVLAEVANYDQLTNMRFDRL